jgi:hypothetical protein
LAISDGPFAWLRGQLPPQFMSMIGLNPGLAIGLEEFLKPGMAEGLNNLLSITL